MIDLHTHILPGVDDGATDLDMALAMARDAAAKGVTAIAATPHFYELPQWPLVKQKVEELRSEFNNAQIGVELAGGADDGSGNHGNGRRGNTYLWRSGQVLPDRVSYEADSHVRGGSPL